MAKQRVQVQDLPDAPKLQATVQSGGQYGVAVQQAGRNKLMDLADQLTVFNQGLKEYGAFRAYEGEYQRGEGEQFALENPEKAQATLDAQRSKTKQELRKLVEKGAIDERSNPDFLLGIRVAGAKTSAKEFRRQLLTNAEALQTEDPVAYAQEQVAGFYQTVDSAYARKAVQPLLESISNEFVSTVARRQQDVAIAQGKIDWLGSIEDEVKAWTGNKLDLTDASFKEWIDDGAGSFKGSRQFAMDNLFKPTIMDMVERGNVGGAMRKIAQLKNWNINKSGAKFANAETLKSLNAIEKDIITNGEYYTQVAITSYNRSKGVALEPFETEFQQRLNDDLPITDAFFRDWSARARKQLPRNGVKKSDVERFIASQREEANKSYNRDADANVVTDMDVYADIRSQLNLGNDQLKAINTARNNNELGSVEVKELLKANADETDFEKNVMSRPSVRERSETIQNQFSDIQFKNGIAALGGNKKTNMVKRLIGLSNTGVVGDKFSIPQETLDVLGADAQQMFRDAMRAERQRILDATPDITRPELDRELSNRVAEVYENTISKIEDSTVEKLRTGMYGLGLKKTSSLWSTVLSELGFTDRQSSEAFIEAYKTNNF